MRRFALLVGGLAVLAGVASAVSGGATQAQPRWVITNLGTLGGQESEARAINERMQIVGWADTRAKDKEGEPIRHAFLWEKGKMLDLTPDGSASAATGINGRGQVVGWVAGKDGPHAALWEKGKMRDLGIIVPDSLPLAMNDRGQVVGTRADLRAFLWQNGRTRILGSKRGQASAINDHGQIAGQTFTIGANGGAIFHAFIWENLKMRALGGLGGASNSAYGINEHGQVVGQADLKAKDADSKYEDPIFNAFLWQQGRMRNLGSPARYSVAYGINQGGQIIGSMTALGENQDSRATLWQKGKRIGLGTLGFGSEAVAINVRGQAVGWSETRDWDRHAVLWTLKRG